MTHEAILEQLRKIVKRLCADIDVSRADENTLLMEQLGMDSLTLLLLALQSEKEFGIRFENMQASSFRTVGDVCSYIEGKL